MCITENQTDFSISSSMQDLNKNKLLRLVSFSKPSDFLSHEMWIFFSSSNCSIITIIKMFLKAFYF